MVEQQPYITSILSPTDALADEASALSDGTISSVASSYPELASFSTVCLSLHGCVSFSYFHCVDLVLIRALAVQPSAGVVVYSARSVRRRSLDTYFYSRLAASAPNSQVHGPVPPSARKPSLPGAYTPREFENVSSVEQPVRDQRRSS